MKVPNSPKEYARLRQSVPVAVLVVAVGLTFANTLHNGFHLDDFYRVVDNPGIHRVWPISRHFLDPGTMSTLDRITQYRPLLPLTLSLNYALAGDSLPGYHAANLLFHLAASILVYFLLLELLRHWSGAVAAARWPAGTALFAALLFGVHPVSGIIVNYICARDLTLMQLFSVASLLAYVRMRRTGGTWWRWTIVLALLALALLAKPGAIIAPAIIVLFEVTLARQSPRHLGPWLRAVPSGLVGAAFLAYSKFALGFSDLSNVVREGGSPVGYALTQLRLHLVHYLRNFFWPLPIRQSPLVAESGSIFEPETAAGLALLIGSLAVAWRFRKRNPLVAFCIGAYWVLLLPESSIFPFHHLAVDYRPYPSSPFFYLLAAMAVLSLTPRRAAIALGVTAVVALAGASIYLNTTWRTEETLWTYSVTYGGDALAHMNLAMGIADRTDPRVRFHLEEALRQQPDYVLVHINLGLLLIRLGEREQGLAHCRRAVEIRPDWAQAHYWLSHAYNQIGATDEAAREAEHAARRALANLGYQLWAAQLMQRQRRYAESLPYLERVEAADDTYQDTLFLKGFALQMGGDRGGAMRMYERFLARRADHYQAHFNLGYAQMEVGDCAAAVAHFERVLELKPDYDAARLHLGACRASLMPGAPSSASSGTTRP